LVGGFARTAEAQLLVESGWAQPIVAARSEVRASAPRIEAAGDDYAVGADSAAARARLSPAGFAAARAALQAGAPVLVQVPRRGYVPALACARDRTPARCPACAGPLGAPGPDAVATCRWCARPAGDWTCPTCGGRRMRAVVVGSARTAEELGRAFPGVTVRTSGGSQVLDAVPAGPALVIATPGAEPVAPEGYGAALLLDGWALLSRPDLRAAEETVRRWVNAAALVRSDGRVVIGADAAIPAVQALVRWDPAGAAARELGERAELRFPPSARLAAVSGRPDAVRELLELAQLPAGAEVLGTIPASTAAGEETERALLRVPRSGGAQLAAALKVGAASRSARKAPDPVKIVLDPRELA
jgi:primosomal protein N' (replication factor Y)